MPPQGCRPDVNCEGVFVLTSTFSARFTPATSRPVPTASGRSLRVGSNVRHAEWSHQRPGGGASKSKCCLTTLGAVKQQKNSLNLEQRERVDLEATLQAESGHGA